MQLWVRILCLGVENILNERFAKIVPYPGFEGRWDLVPLVEVVVEVEVVALAEAKLLFMLMLFTNANNG